MNTSNSPPLSKWNQILFQKDQNESPENPTHAYLEKATDEIIDSLRLVNCEAQFSPAEKTRKKIHKPANENHTNDLNRFLLTGGAWRKNPGQCGKIKKYQEYKQNVGSDPFFQLLHPPGPQTNFVSIRVPKWFPSGKELRAHRNLSEIFSNSLFLGLSFLKNIFQKTITKRTSVHVISRYF